MNRDTTHYRTSRMAAIFAATFGLVGLVPASASAGTSAVPASSAPPAITGNPRAGQTLTAQNGSWDNNATAFSYQWQQCSSAGTGCSDIGGATSQRYTVSAGDVDHTLRVIVTASNGDGQSSATSETSSVVSSRSAPANTSPPTLSGTPKAGEQLTAATGTWTGGVRTFDYQWQRCDSAGAGCTDVPDATGRTYGVRTADVGFRIRVLVSAQSGGGTTTAASAATAAVAAAGGTVTTTTTVRANRAPRIRFLSLRRIHGRVYARFVVCDDSSKAVTVIEHDVKSRDLGYRRRFTVVPVPCGSHLRTWRPAPRFQTHGRLVITLRAVDKSGATRSSGRAIALPPLSVRTAGRARGRRFGEDEPRTDRRGSSSTARDGRSRRTRRVARSPAKSRLWGEELLCRRSFAAGLPGITWSQSGAVLGESAPAGPVAVLRALGGAGRRSLGPQPAASRLVSTGPEAPPVRRTERATARDQIGRAPGSTSAPSGSGTISSRIFSSERRIRRETCICEMPTCHAICDWVSPS